MLLPGALALAHLAPGLRGGLVLKLVASLLLGIALASVAALLSWCLGPVGCFHDGLWFSGGLRGAIWIEWGAILLLSIALPLRVWSALRRKRKEKGGTGAVAGEDADSGSASRVGSDQPAKTLTAEDRLIREAYLLAERHKRGGPVAPGWASLLALVGMVVAAGVLGFYGGAALGFDTDGPDHLACIREMFDTDRILPNTVFHADGDGAKLDARKGFFHVVLAEICVLGGVAPERLWELLPGILGPFMVLVFHAFSRRILRTEGAALLATLMGLVCFANLDSGLLPRLGYGSRFGIVAGWGVLALAFHYVFNEADKRVFLLVAAASLAAMAVHVFTLAHAAGMLGATTLAFLLARSYRSSRVRRAAQALGAVLVGAIPLLLWRLAFAFGGANEIHTHTQGMILFGSGLMIPEPGQWERYLLGAGAVPVALSLLLWRKGWEEDDTALLLASSSALPFLVLLNPFLVGLLEPLGGYMISRLALLAPCFAVLAFLARRMGDYLVCLRSPGRIVTALGYFALMWALFFPRVGSLAASYSSQNMERIERRSIEAWRPLLSHLEASVDEPSVVLSDPLTGYAIVALTKHWTVAVLNQHGNPSDSLALARLAAARDVLSPLLGTVEKARACRRFSVDYVLVNTSFSGPYRAFFCQVDCEISRRQIEALEKDDSLFRKIWDVPGQGALFRVVKESVDGLAGVLGGEYARPHCRRLEEAAAEVMVRRLPDEAGPVVADTCCGATVVAARVLPAKVPRGSEVVVELYWSRAGEPGSFPMEGHLRLETEAPRGRLWNMRYSKIHRVFLQWRTGLRYRLRKEFLPFQGTFGVEHWPPYRYLVDRLRVRIPENAARGDYVVKVKWMEQTFLPNLPVSHFFCDRDAYDGAPIGYVEVF